MDWQMLGSIAAVVVPVGGLIAGLVVMSANRQIDLVNQKVRRGQPAFDALRAENRAAHAQIGTNVDGLRATPDALLLKLVPAGSRTAGRREGARR